MQRVVLRAAVLAAGLVLAVQACSSTATPPPTGLATQPAASASQAAASQAAATAASLPPATPEATASPVQSPPPSPSPAPAGLAGTWNGTWKDTSPDTSGGTFVLTWTQDGNALTGNIVVKGTPCLTAATITGSVNGSAISFGAVSGKNTVVYNGSISGSTMKGSYVAPAACADAKGTWAATRK